MNKIGYGGAFITAKGFIRKGDRLAAPTYDVHSTNNRKGIFRLVGACR